MANGRGGKGEGKGKGGGKGKGKGEGKGKGKGEGKGRGWMHGDGYSPVAGRWLRNTSGNGPPGDLRRHRSLGSCPVPRQLGHEDAHFGRAAGQLDRGAEDGDVPNRRFPEPASARSAPCSTKSPTWWAVLTRCTCMQSAQCRLLPRRRTATAATAAAPAETAATAPARLRTEGEGAPREAEAAPAQALRIALRTKRRSRSQQRLALLRTIRPQACRCSM